MTKSERKAFTLRYGDAIGQPDKRYFALYQIIANENITNPRLAKEKFLAQYPGGAYDVEVKYLYTLLTDMLLQLRNGKDVHTTLLTDIAKARMFFERSLFEESFDLISSVISRANNLGLNEILLIAQKLELEFFQSLDFLDISEQEIFDKHTLQRKAIKSVSLITEHASLYDLLRQRVHQMGGAIHTTEEVKMMSDLVMSEFYSFSSEPEKPFELERNHRIFQAKYLMETGDISGALNVYNSLDRLLAEYSQQPASSPFYRLSVLEGILKALRYARRYDEMGPFVQRLEQFAVDPQADIRTTALCLQFQYELVPHLDRGNFKKCREIIERYRKPLLERESRPNPVRECELQMYHAIVELVSGNWRKVSRIISTAMVNENIKYLPMMRTVRLIRLMAYYELDEHDLLQYEARSIARSRRNISFATESMMLRFLSNSGLPPMQRQRMAIWNKMKPAITRLSADKHERQILLIFDFTAWIESKLTGIALDKILALRGKSYE